MVVLEQAERLEETGAGLQLSPNATRLLIALGLRDALLPRVVAPAGLRVLDGKSGREIVRMPLGEAAAERYGSPYWVIHRGDLQATLAGAVAERLDVRVKLGARADDFAVHSNGVTVSTRHRGAILQEHGAALVAADGLWSGTRAQIGYREPPRFAGRTAWRALVPAELVAAEFREPWVQLWLGRNAHVVHYPVKGGSMINVVVIADDTWHERGWSEPAAPADLLACFAARRWAPKALALVSAPEAWLKWALYGRRPLLHWAQGPVMLLGDAAHPMLPYLAQGAAMAIEDATVAAHCLARSPDDPSAAWRMYETMRRRRAWKVQRLAARNGGRYHLGGVQAMLRNAAMRAIGGMRLLNHYDWLYAWRPPAHPLLA